MRNSKPFQHRCVYQGVDRVLYLSNRLKFSKGVKMDRRDNETVFRIEIRPPNDCVSNRPFRVSPQQVQGEYATRYLEKLGVKPSKTTLDIVQRSVPLSTNCIKHTLRVRRHPYPCASQRAMVAVVLRYSQMLKIVTRGMHETMAK